MTTRFILFPRDIIYLYIQVYKYIYKYKHKNMYVCIYVVYGIFGGWWWWWWSEWNSDGR